MTSNDSPQPIDLQPDLLGTSDIDPSVVGNYAERRKIAAVNIAGELMARDVEYERQQTEVNGRFLSDLESGFPGISISYGAERYTPKTLKLHGLHVTDLAATVSYGPGAQENDVTGEHLADLSSVRAATIWVGSETEDQINMQVRGIGAEYSTVSITPEITLPYVLVGHRHLNGHGGTEVLLMPLIPRVTSEDSFYSHNRPANLIEEIEFGGVEAVLSWNNRLITAQMTNEQYDDLITVQEALFDLGLKPEEVRSIHDEHKGVFTISHSKVDTVKGHLHKGVHLPVGHKHPDKVEDLAHGEFSLTHASFREAKLNPVEFLEFNVLKDSQRTAAMLGRATAFESAKDRLVKNSYQDPKGAWLDKAVSS